jgi:hypothetical protein
VLEQLSFEKGKYKPGLPAASCSAHSLSLNTQEKKSKPPLYPENDCPFIAVSLQATLGVPTGSINCRSNDGYTWHYDDHHGPYDCKKFDNCP